MLLRTWHVVSGYIFAGISIASVVL